MRQKVFSFRFDEHILNKINIRSRVANLAIIAVFFCAGILVSDFLRINLLLYKSELRGGFGSRTPPPLFVEPTNILVISDSYCKL